MPDLEAVKCAAVGMKRLFLYLHVSEKY